MVCKTFKLQGYIVQHKEYNQHLTVTMNWNITFKSYESLCCTPVTYVILL